MAPLPTGACGGAVAAAGQPRFSGSSCGGAGCLPERPGKHETVSEGDVRALAQLLASLTSSAVGDEEQSQRFRRFYAIHPPQIDIFDYLARMFAHFKCSHECYVVASVYIDRVLRCHPDFVLNGLTIHRLLLTSLVLAVKFTDDAQFPNSWYAQVGGVSNRELNALEAELLQLLGWRAHVTQQEYEAYHAKLRALASPSSGAGGAKRARAETVEDEMESTRAEDSSSDAVETVDGTETTASSPVAAEARTLSPPPQGSSPSSQASSCACVATECGPPGAALPQELRPARRGGLLSWLVQELGGSAPAADGRLAAAPCRRRSTTPVPCMARRGRRGGRAAH